jgi:methionine--tRNA ligase beta chain
MWLPFSLCYSFSVMSIPIKPQTTIEEFSKLDIRVGTILHAESVEGSSKLIKLQVDFGELGERQVFTGMAKWYSPEDLIGMQTVFIVNFPPRKMMGEESHGMVLALGLTNDTKPVFLVPKTEVGDGEGVR